MSDIFNISQLIDNILESSDQNKVEIGRFRCVLNEFVPINTSFDKIFIHQNIVYIKLFSSTIRHALKLKKMSIIDECKKNKIPINDIIVY